MTFGRSSPFTPSFLGVPLRPMARSTARPRYWAVAVDTVNMPSGFRRIFSTAWPVCTWKPSRSQTVFQKASRFSFESCVFLMDPATVLGRGRRHGKYAVGVPENLLHRLAGLHLETFALANSIPEGEQVLFRELRLLNGPGQRKLHRAGQDQLLARILGDGAAY